jgi:molybdate transport system substrate-binding protein
VTRGRTNYLVPLSIVLLLVAVSLSQGQARTQGQEIRVAAASDLQFAMEDLAAHFEKQTGMKVDVTYGSSGNFFSQIQNGAPFDIFFSADVDYPRKLEAMGLGAPRSLFVYGVGRLVIWMPADGKADVAQEGWNALLSPGVQKISIADPEHAPYGRAAVAALKKAGVYQQVKAKLVYAENISQAAQFVQSGNAQAGILAKSLAASGAMESGKRWDVPVDLYPAIEQGAILLKSANNNAKAKSFLEFVRGPAGRSALDQYGFGPAAPGSTRAQ